MKKSKKTKPRWRLTKRGWEHPEHGLIQGGRCSTFWAMTSPYKPGEYLGGAPSFTAAKRHLEQLSREAQREKRARQIKSGGLAVPEAFA